MPTYNWGTSLSSPGVTGDPMRPYGPRDIKYDLYSLDPIGIGGTEQGYWQHYNTLANKPLQSPELTRTGTGGGGMGGVSAIPMWNAARGMWVNSVTGQPYSGTDPNTGKQYVKGQPTTEPVPYSGGKQINPNDPTQRYQAVNITKSPEIAQATSDMLNTFNKTANSALQDFNSYLNNYKSQVGQAFKSSQEAMDIAPVSAELTAQQQAYANALNQAAKQYETLNAQTAAKEQAIVGQAQGYLPAYDQAITNAEGLQLGNMLQQVNRYKAASGVPRGLGSSELRQLAAGTAAVTVPLEQAKIQQQYNVLSNYALPTTLDVANRETSRISQFNPWVASEQFRTGQATAETIQRLAMETANMGYADALKYMQALGVPYQIQQQILTGEIGQLGALANLYSGSRYQGLQDIMGANITPAVGYNINMGAYPTPTRYTGNYGLGTARGPIGMAPNRSTLGPMNWSGGYGAVPANTGYDATRDVMYNTGAVPRYYGGSAPAAADYRVANYPTPEALRSPESISLNAGVNPASALPWPYNLAAYAGGKQTDPYAALGLTPGAVY